MLKGDGGDAFSEIYERYSERLYKYIYNRTRSHDVAFELSQEIFTNLWERREVIEFHAKLSSFLFSCARNQLVMHIKREQNKEKYYPEFIRFCSSPSQNPTEEVVYVNELQENIKRSLATLPKRCQEIFRLSRQEHRTTKEIAQQLNISQKTVENQLTTALKHLRVFVGELVILLFVFFH